MCEELPAKEEFGVGHTVAQGRRNLEETAREDLLNGRARAVLTAASQLGIIDYLLACGDIPFSPHLTSTSEL